MKLADILHLLVSFQYVYAHNPFPYHFSVVYCDYML